MAALGTLLLLIGGLSYLLPHVGLQLKLVKLLQMAHPDAGQYCLIAGGVLLVLGLVFPGRAPKLPDVGEVVPDKDEDEKGGSVGLVGLLAVAILCGAVYLQARCGTFDPLLKAAHEEIQKHLRQPTPPSPKP